MKIHFREDTIYDIINRAIASNTKTIDTIELSYYEMQEFKDSYDYVIIHDEDGDFSHFEYRGIRIVLE